ncbi:hypothetical protein SEA_CURSIVE_159 [Streptomyces phage Cursive]
MVQVGFEPTSTKIKSQLHYQTVRLDHKGEVKPHGNPIVVLLDYTTLFHQRESNPNVIEHPCNDALYSDTDLNCGPDD